MPRVLSDSYQPRVQSPNVPDELAGAFPDEGPIHAWMWWATQTTHAPPIFLLGALLPCMAHLAAVRGYRIGPTARPPSIWSCLIGPSGTAKSTAMRRAIEFTEDHLRQQTPKDETFVTPFLETEGTIPGLLEALALAYDAERDITCRVLFDEEFTRLINRRGEAVAEVLQKLADNRSVKRQLRQYHAAKAKGEAVADTVRSPALSALFATTGAALADVLTAAQYEGGLFSRVAWFRGSLGAAELDLEEDPRARQRDDVLSVWTHWSRGLSGEDHRLAHVLGDLREARLVRFGDPVKVVLRKQLFDQLRKAYDETSRLNSLIFRLTSLAQTVAGLYAISRGSLNVDVDSMHEACELAHLLFKTAADMDGSVAVSKSLQDQERVLRVIADAAAEGASRAKLYERCRLNKRELDDAIATLIDRDRIVETKLVTRRRGRPSFVYRLAEKPPLSVIHGDQRERGPFAENESKVRVLKAVPGSPENNAEGTEKPGDDS